MEFLFCREASIDYRHCCCIFPASIWFVSPPSPSPFSSSIRFSPMSCPFLCSTPCFPCRIAEPFFFSHQEDPSRKQQLFRGEGAPVLPDRHLEGGATAGARMVRPSKVKKKKNSEYITSCLFTRTCHYRKCLRHCSW